MKNNSKAAKKQLGATQEYVEEYLTDQVYTKKMQDAIKAAADTTVTDEEANMKSIEYVFYNTQMSYGSDGSMVLPTEDDIKTYKEAKKTGKSVEEIVEKDQKRKEKLARKAEEDDDDDDDDEDDYIEEGHYRVKTRRTVASGGSSYITGRKAEAEARAEREARYARNQAKQKKK